MSDKPLQEWKRQFNKELQDAYDQRDEARYMHDCQIKISGELQQQLADCERERDRLLVLATKHCDRSHHDWKEILEIAHDWKIGQENKS